MSEAEASDDTVTSRAVIIRVPVAIHRALRIRVAEEDTSIQQWVLALMQRELEAAGQNAKRKR